MGSLVMMAAMMVLFAQDSPAPTEAPPPPTLEGLWLTEKKDGQIRITRCGVRFCGALTWMAEPLDDQGRERLDLKNPDRTLRDRPIRGMQILDLGAKTDRKGVHHDCRIYDPARGDRYRCKIRLEGERIRMRGYLGISLFGRTTYWTRLE